MAIIAPSILSANFAELGGEVAALEAAGADWVHIDVMDGRFVPNITIGPMVTKAVRGVTKLPLDVHLMIVEPDRYLEPFRDAGADILTVHAEASTHLHRTLSHIRSLGMKAGVSLNPGTPLEAIEWVLDTVDVVLIMSVNPGFGGQSFIPSSLEKIALLAAMKKAGGFDFTIEVDGGINPKTTALVTEAGAEALVAGAYVFGEKPYAKTISALRDAARPACIPSTEST